MALKTIEKFKIRIDKIFHPRPTGSSGLLCQSQQKDKYGSEDK